MMSRFERQILLPGFGIEAQQKLQQARVLVIGVGGLGCPVLLYLAAAGVGCIDVIDGDLVSLSNLNRQIIFSEKDVNKPKAEVAAAYLREKYSDIRIGAIMSFLTPDNIFQTISDYDLVLDGTDNFETRYMVNDACVLLNKPLVFGAIYKNEGQVSVFNVADKHGVRTNYRDVFPQMPSPHEIPNCSETGVLGVLPGMIGMHMATQTIKLITGYGALLVNKMLIYNLLFNSSYEIDISPNEAAQKNLPKTRDAFYKMDYKIACASFDIDSNWEEVLVAKMQAPENVLLIDSREPYEEPKLEDIACIELPFDQVLKTSNRFGHFHTIFVFCQFGIRSRFIVMEMRKQWPQIKIFSVKGGMSEFLTHKNRKKNAS